MRELEFEVSRLIIDTLNLEGVTIDDIDPTEPLFGDGGLGLDSIDALELGVAIQRSFGIKIDSNATDLREHFASIRSLSAYIAASRTR